jgi:hypothetical protein
LETPREKQRVADFGQWIQAGSIVRYVIQRQNDDGGYTFAQWSESSAQDTYYALEILKMLGVPAPHTKSTINFLRGLQHSDWSFDSIKVAYYVLKSLNELGATLEKNAEQVILMAQGIPRKLGTVEVNIEASSEIETTYFSLETLQLVKTPFRSDSLPGVILKLRNPDGSFGEGGYSRMASVYYALASLQLLGYDPNSLDSTIDWVRACEDPAGGFARSPNDFDAYLVLEEMYYGLKTLEVLGQAPLYPRQNLSLIGKFQNGNGGFRRSIYLGISTFEDTFYALSALQALCDRAHIPES